MLVKAWTYNPNDLYREQGVAEQEERYSEVEAIIRAGNPHVLAVQEMPWFSRDEAEAAMRRLAKATGLRCEIQQGGRTICTVARSNHSNLAVGLLWHPDITPVSWRIVQPAVFWHAFAVARLRIDGVEIDHGVYQGPPRVERPVEIVAQERITEAPIVADEMMGPDSNPNGCVSADWNAMSADLIDGRYPDPEPEFTLGLAPDARRLALDPRPGEILRDRGLVDAIVARESDDPQPTTGHWQAEKYKKYGKRRIDRTHVTPAMRRALRWQRTINTAATRRVSDHLPAETVYDTELLTQ